MVRIKLVVMVVFFLLVAHSAGELTETNGSNSRNATNITTIESTGDCYGWTENVTGSSPCNHKELSNIDKILSRLETKHYIYGSISMIILAQLVILVIIIKNRRQKIFRLKPKEERNLR